MANVRPCTEYMASNRGFLSARAISSRVGTFGRRESRWGDVTTKTLIKFFSSQLGEPQFPAHRIGQVFCRICWLITFHQINVFVAESRSTERLFSFVSRSSRHAIFFVIIQRAASVPSPALRDGAKVRVFLCAPCIICD
jgi:hypothetical protein